MRFFTALRFAPGFALRVLLGLAVGIAALHAGAQALPTASGPGLYFSAGVEASAFQVDYGKRIDGGYTILGAMHLKGRYNLEGEARFIQFHTDEQVTQRNLLIGPSVNILRVGHIQPYAKFLVGSGHMVFPFQYATGNYLVLAPGGGVDIPLNSVVTIRAVDFEYQSWQHFTYGNLHPYGVSAGITFRLTRPNIFKKDPYVY
ncbi:hypothetical protein ACFQBQ_12490 [Granulicella cerasi]|uniref:Outer membrane protein beta-barrel domain-containing protein n=1 Tax=Granulicella cerasi TaxID=741063 RepID=A0ABW1ZCL0_9BACT|nr:hypothetical protein [Granulicella cerasi]